MVVPGCVEWSGARAASFLGAWRVIYWDVSAVLLAVGQEYGERYQGVQYVRAVTAMSVAWWSGLIVLAALALRQPSVGRNLWFHVALFSWLAWYAAPYMGELP